MGLLIELREYDPGWEQAFEAEREVVAQAFGDGVVAIEHIGSTAVPGLAAKPIIDILVGVRSLDLVDERVFAMEAAGYEYLGEHGLPGRLFFRKGDPRSHHVHAVEHGGEHWQRHLLFRDYLRTHPQEAERYGALKRELATEASGDRALYTDRKTPYIDGVVARARERV